MIFITLKITGGLSIRKMKKQDLGPMFSFDPKLDRLKGGGFE